jgi:hypothetical protein
MTQINLTAEQAELLTGATGPIVLCRPDGIVVGYASRQPHVVTPKEPIFTPEEIAEAERRIDSPGPWYTTQEVLARLRSLGPE